MLATTPELNYETLKEAYDELIKELENIRHPALDGIVKSWQILLKNMDGQLAIKPLPVSTSHLARDLQQNLMAFPILVESCEFDVRIQVLSIFNQTINSLIPEVPNKCEFENEYS